jgi:membrane dipeptidase
MDLKIIDAHQDLLWYEQNKKENENLQTGFDLINNSVVKLVVAAVFIDGENKTKNEILELVRRDLVSYQKYAQQYNMLVVTNYQDLFALFASNRHGLLLHIEGLDFLTPENINCLDDFYNLGLRSVGLVWGQRNAIMSSANNKGGLSDFGKEVIQRLNDLGIIIDLAHANEESFYDVIATSKKPVMVSHGNACAICQSPRNFTDKQIALLVKRKGVIGVFFSKKYLTTNITAKREDVLRQLEYLYKLAPNSLMIGSDFGGITTGIPIGLEGIDKYPLLFQEIEKRLGNEAGQKIVYLNFKTFLEKHFYETSD